MPTDDEVRAGAAALAKTFAAGTPFPKWSDQAQQLFQDQARAVLEAAEKVRK